MEHAWLRAAHSGALHSHQRDGIRWLYRRSGCGGILGDDPGLGKSLQAIALVHALVAARQVRRVLVVAPANLVKNWQLELGRWSAKVAPKLTVAYAGAGEAGLHDELKFRQLVQTRDDAHLVLVTSYESLLDHGDALRASCGVDLLLADEAHRMRNDGKQANGVAKVPALARLLLTATPLPNNLDELYTTVDLAVRGRLGTRAHFNADFNQPITAGRAADASDADKEEGALQAAQLSAICGEVMLRRTSAQLERGLPPKTTAVVMCRPTPLQRELHTHLESSSLEKALTRLHLIRSVHRHPPDLEAGSVSGKRLLRSVTGKLPEQPATRMLLSGKMQACARLLDTILTTTDEKVVVVSSSRAALHAVDAYVQSLDGHGSASVGVLGGGVGKKARHALMKRFNDTLHVSSMRVVTLIDRLAEGVTLTGANHLVLLDPSWNPAVDAQALGRVHRPGQLKPCYLYRLLSTGTIDETILDRQVGKSSLLAMLCNDTLPAVQSDDRALLFQLDEPSVASRLHARMEDDSPYADAHQWRPHNLGFAADASEDVLEDTLQGMDEGPLRVLCGLKQQTVTLTFDVAGGESDDDDRERDADPAEGAGGGEEPMPDATASTRLVSFVFCSVSPVGADDDGKEADAVET